MPWLSGGGDALMSIATDLMGFEGGYSDQRRPCTGKKGKK